MARPRADAIARLAGERADGGFTLVEMLVSLALSALIALLLTQSLQITGFITRGAQKRAAQDEVQLVRDHLRRTLADAVRRRRDGRPVAFVGRTDWLVSTIAANRAAERMAEMQIGIVAAGRPDGAGVALLETARLASGADQPEDSEILLDGIAALRFRYFGVQALDGSAGWQPRWAATWARTDRLPALVEVTVDFPPGDGRRWPALVLSLGAGA